MHELKTSADESSNLAENVLKKLIIADFNQTEGGFTVELYVGVILFDCKVGSV